MQGLLKAATLCGAVPLLTGTAVYLAWRVTQWGWLIGAGFLTIGAGLLAFLAGAICLASCACWNSSDDPVTRRRPWLKIALAGALLLVNFPAAAFYALSAADVYTRYTVRVSNESGRTIDSFVVTGPGVHLEFGPLAPGARVRRHVHWHGDGVARFVARQQDAQFEDVLEGYVSHGVSGEALVRVTAPGVYEVIRAR